MFLNLSTYRHIGNLMEAKITSLYDEGSLVGTQLIGSRGLSIIVDIDGQRTLFGTGRKGRYLLHNMNQLEISLESIDRVIIPQEDVNYFGGLEDILKNRQSPLDVYVPHVPKNEKGFRSKGLKLSQEELNKASFHPSDGWTNLSEHLSLTPIIDSSSKSECFLILNAEKGPIVISSCSYCGVSTVMNAVKDKMGQTPKGYFGGIHINKKSLDADEIAQTFVSNNCDILYLNHCTGVKGISQLRVNMSLNAVKDFYVGTNVQLKV